MVYKMCFHVHYYVRASHKNLIIIHLKTTYYNDGLYTLGKENSWYFPDVFLVQIVLYVQKQLCQNTHF